MSSFSNDSSFLSTNWTNSNQSQPINIQSPIVLFTFNEIINDFSMFFSMLASLINLVVFANKNLRENHFTYNCLLCMSISDLSYSSLLIIWQYLSRFCQRSPLQCGSSAQYFSQIWSIAILDYFTSCLAIFSIFLEIFLTIQRYFLITNRKYL